jgi:hypothetical protein
VTATDARGLLPATVEAVRAALRREGSVGVIAADSVVGDVASRLAAAAVTAVRLDDSGAEPADARVTVVPATLAKGLEYDSVVVVEPAAIVAADPLEWQGLRRLYVCLTRAVTALEVVHARPLPGPLGDPLAA